MLSSEHTALGFSLTVCILIVTWTLSLYSQWQASSLRFPGMKPYIITPNIWELSLDCTGTGLSLLERWCHGRKISVWTEAQHTDTHNPAGESLSSPSQTSVMCHNTAYSFFYVLRKRWFCKFIDLRQKSKASDTHPVSYAIVQTNLS